jgi:hypothetical protein
LLNHPHGKINRSTLQSQGIRFSGQKLRGLIPDCCRILLRGNRRFTLFGIPEAWAWRLMPVVGSVDIVLGTLTLLAPTRAALLYMTVWGLFTALLRPLAGEWWWEFFERAYNFGVPGLMLWVHSAGTTGNTWFTVITDVPRLTMARAQQYQCSLGMGDSGW